MEHSERTENACLFRGHAFYFLGQFCFVFDFLQANLIRFLSSTRQSKHDLKIRRERIILDNSDKKTAVIQSDETENQNLSINIIDVIYQAVSYKADYCPF